MLAVATPAAIAGDNLQVNPGWRKRTASRANPGVQPAIRIQGRGAWVEYGKADVRQVAGRGASGDDPARFLRELRQLRDGAGLGHAELAARAHFPYDSIRAAEVGPTLPDLPVLSAYVRGCGGTTEEWEERWRSLTRSPSLPVPASRAAGRSDAATAGARIGSVSQVADNPDPSIIIAALSRVAEEMASSGGDPLAPPPPDVESADDLEFAEATLSTVSEPALPDKPAGWDPIRVSTAWPVLRDTPTAAAEPAIETGSAGPPSGSAVTSGVGAPWDAAAWDGTASDASLAGTDPAPADVATVGVAHPAGTASSPAPAAGRDGGAARNASLTRVVVIAAVLLCVIAVLLAVFA